MSDIVGIINTLKSGLDNSMNNITQRVERLESAQVGIIQRIERLENLRKEELREEGREEIRNIVREAAELPELANEARQKLEERGILPKIS